MQTATTIFSVFSNIKSKFLIPINPSFILFDKQLTKKEKKNITIVNKKYTWLTAWRKKLEMKKKKQNKTICSISKTRTNVECKHLELNLFVCIVWVAVAPYYNGINWFASGFCYLQQVHAVQAKKIKHNNAQNMYVQHICMALGLFSLMRAAICFYCLNSLNRCSDSILFLAICFIFL